MELWAGIECTVNRIGDRYADQLAASGHADRDGDLDLLAGLGIAALRYPVLWERTEREPPAERWRWAERRLARLRELGVRPVVGLVHHGSGPPHTSLVDPRFPDLLAAYARACAERFPWVRDWTPVNEPLTTARFSALYGHWYPHARDDRSFVAALLHQCVGVARAMRAIRAVNPDARLVQTEDFGRTWSTPALYAQAWFDNERRWLTFDLLCGRVTPEHMLWDYFTASHADAALLEELRAAPCPPDVLGLNHYLTSERWLDERLARYPPHTHGGNHHQRYADVEAVRVGKVAGPQRLIEGVWARYRLPIAVTETHLHCTREEQLRWLHHVWRDAERAAARGADVRAVTAWAALGSFDWDSLLTLPRGHYEPGVFDVRGGRPRPTALASVARDLATTGASTHRLLAAPGWWRRETRVLYDAVTDLAHEPVAALGQPLLVTGRTGTLGRAFAAACERRALRAVVTARGDVDVTDEAAIRTTLARVRPWAVVNTAGYVDVHAAERDRERCWRANACEALARVCADLGIPLVTFSTDLVFDGRSRTPYRESDPVQPLCAYGSSKAAAERTVLALHPGALVVRTAAFFSPADDYNFVTCALRELLRGRPFQAYDAVTVSPTYVPDLVDATLDLLIDGERGLWHLANRGQTTWLEFGRAAAALAGAHAELVRPCPAPAYMPAFTPLTSERAVLLPPLESALERYWHAGGERVRAAAATS